MNLKEPECKKWPALIQDHEMPKWWLIELERKKYLEEHPWINNPTPTIGEQINVTNENPKKPKKSWKKLSLFNKAIILWIWTSATLIWSDFYFKKQINNLQLENHFEKILDIRRRLEWAMLNLNFEWKNAILNQCSYIDNWESCSLEILLPNWVDLNTEERVEKKLEKKLEEKDLSEIERKKLNLYLKAIKLHEQSEEINREIRIISWNQEALHEYNKSYNINWWKNWKYNPKYPDIPYKINNSQITLKAPVQTKKECLDCHEKTEEKTYLQLIEKFWALAYWNSAFELLHNNFQSLIWLILMWLFWSIWWIHRLYEDSNMIKLLIKDLESWLLRIISDENLELNEKLQQSLELILNCEEMWFLNKWSIHLINPDNPKELLMVASLNLHPELHNQCSKRSLEPNRESKCHCDTCAETWKAFLVSHIDDNHWVTFDWITPHWHYESPIIINWRCIWNLNLYLKNWVKKLPEWWAEFIALATSTVSDLIKFERLKLEKDRIEKRTNAIFEWLSNAIFTWEFDHNTWDIKFIVPENSHAEEIDLNELLFFLQGENVNYNNIAIDTANRYLLEDKWRSLLIELTLNPELESDCICFNLNITDITELEDIKKKVLEMAENLRLVLDIINTPVRTIKYVSLKIAIDNQIIDNETLEMYRELWIIWKFEKMWGIPVIDRVNQEMCELTWYSKNMLEWQALLTAKFFSKTDIKNIMGMKRREISINRDSEEKWIISKNIWEYEINWIHRDWSIIPVRVSATSLKKINWTVRTVSTLTDLRKEFIEPLTGLVNKPWFDLKLLSQIEYSTENGKGFILLIIDLDKFKIANDTHWHEIWDEILKIAASKIRNLVKKTDCVARLWWDEFTIILDTEDMNKAIQIAQNIIEAISKEIIIKRKDGTVINIEIWSTIWIWKFPEDDINNWIFANTDAALLEQKQTQRWKFRLFDTSIALTKNNVELRPEEELKQVKEKMREAEALIERLVESLGNLSVNRLTLEEKASMAKTLMGNLSNLLKDLMANKNALNGSSDDINQLNNRLIQQITELESSISNLNKSIRLGNMIG